MSSEAIKAKIFKAYDDYINHVNSQIEVEIQIKELVKASNRLRTSSGKIISKIEKLESDYISSLEDEDSNFDSSDFSNSEEAFGELDLSVTDDILDGIEESNRKVYNSDNIKSKVWNYFQKGKF